MDLGAILPLLLAGKKEKSGDFTAALITSILQGKKLSQKDLLGTVIKARGGSPEMAEALSSAMENGGRARPTKTGFTPLLGFVNDDILGKMTKFYSTPKR